MTAPTRRMTIDDLASIAVASQPTLADDGRLAYVLRTSDTDADRNVHQLWLAAPGEEPRRLTGGNADTSPSWSPDGGTLAFLRAQDGPAQVHLLPAHGGEARALTDLPLGAGAPLWSPDGTRIAFTAPVDIAGERTPTQPYVTDRLDYQADGSGKLGTVRTHVHVVDVATGEVRQLTSGDQFAGTPAWSPDGATLAFPLRPGPGNDLACRIPVATISADDPKALPVTVGLEDGLAAAVAWAPDGSLLVVGYPGDPTGHAHLLRLRDGALTDLAPGLDRNVMAGAPAYPGATPVVVDDDVLFCVRDRGCTHLYAVPLIGGDARPVLTGAGRVVAGLSVAGGTAAVSVATPTSYGEIVTVDLATGTETTHTDHGSGLADVELFPRVEREFSISDGTTVHGWLVRDPEADGRGPLLLDVHGGPHNAWNGAADDIHLYHQELVARGWTVLLLNPRGSDGYGEAFYTGVHGGWGTADSADFLEPIDTLVAEGVADPSRLAVAGYSYGGFTTCYLTGLDQRFAAAVAGGVVSDLASMGGTSDDAVLLSQWELGGTPWREPELIAAQSPISRVAQVTTPTLVIHGAADVRCPVGQAQQWFTALRELGVPTELVLYPEASHLFILEGPPSQRLDFNRRVAGWLEQYAGDPAGPRRRTIDGAHWQRRLSALAARHDVPGAQLGILRLGGRRPDELVTAAYGSLNLDADIPATADSLFQIGSISKVWTTTVAMQLVDEGKLSLDAPVVEVLPELELSDPEVTKQVTLRHLLTHTSGIDGDVFTDTGRGDDCLEKYTALLSDAAQNHPLGATWSYCNSGFVLVGRIIEKITGRTWDEAMRERLFTPLGLTHTVTLPEEALRFGAAVGHVEVEGKNVVAPAWGLMRSVGPAGLITSTVSDVLAFARLHLTGGLAPDGTRLLSEESAATMAELQADLPDKYSLGDSWGLGWIRFGWDGHRLIGHDGNTIGQAAFLRVLPEEGLAVAMLTNGGHTRDLYEDLYREIFAELADVAMPTPLAPPDEPVEVDVTPYLGTYERASVKMEILTGDDGPRLRTTLTGPLAELEPKTVEEYPLVPVADRLFVVRPEGIETWAPVTFYELPTGERYVHFGVRATPKVD